MAPRQVLIIDPDRHARELMRQYLVAAKFDVTDFANGNHGMEQCVSDPPALVIAEVFGMPLDGFAVCRQVRETEELADTAVVLVSFLAAEDRASEVDADAFLLKPLDRPRFLDTVGLAIERRTPNRKIS